MVPDQGSHEYPGPCCSDLFAVAGAAQHTTESVNVVCLILHDSKGDIDAEGRIVVRRVVFVRAVVYHLVARAQMVDQVGAEFHSRMVDVYT